MSTAPAKQNTPAATAPSTPDPSRGIFETLLVADGEPVELAAHLARLGASLEALYGAGPPRRLGAQVREQASGLALARLRIVVAPAPAAGTADRADGTAWSVDVTAAVVDPGDVFPSRERAAELRTLSHEGGMGRHKWADRRLLDRVAAPAVPLLLDRGDEVLEGGRANLFAVRDGALFTPADDGRILPGIARAGAIAAAREAGIEVNEKRLTRTDLLTAEEVFLTGSVRGVEPAGTLDGEPLPPATALSERVAAGLRRRWRTGRLAAAGS